MIPCLFPQGNQMYVKLCFALFEKLISEWLIKDEVYKLRSVLLLHQVKFVIYILTKAKLLLDFLIMFNIIFVWEQLKIYANFNSSIVLCSVDLSQVLNILVGQFHNVTRARYKKALLFVPCIAWYNMIYSFYVILGLSKVYLIYCQVFLYFVTSLN